ncbi:uncharacterized protein LOC134230955 isoform X1 [Saccostrea cucullata]|uniref:uncharacterized protein LOC134230955 isoform X1 n=1 Tax=Saccostrea cuccullata TaxID=36930 RepID=UPI002ED1D1BA
MTVNTQRLSDVQERLEKLLTDKKCLNSKVTSDAFSGFKAAVSKVKAGQTADIGSSLKKLEISLKGEGSYKNVKVGFEAAKTDINEILGAHESPSRVKPSLKATQQPGNSKQANPRAVTVTLSNSHARQKLRAGGPGYQRPHIEPDAPPTIRTRRPPVEIKGSLTKNPGPEEMSSLNKTISRLFNHLEINKLSKESDIKPSTKVRHPRRSPSPHRRHKREEYDVKELLQRLQTFEDELQRRREKQNEDILSLQAQIQKYKIQAADQSKELERLRGIHSITNKAKGRHVGMIEERYQEEKKDFETRMKELENQLKKKYESAIQEKEDTENTLRKDLNKLKKEIQKVGSLSSGVKTSKRPRYRTETDQFDVGELVSTLDIVAKDLQSHQDKNKGIEEDSTVWKSNYLELEKEINRFCHDISPSLRNNSKNISTLRPGSNSVAALQSLLEETRTNVVSRLQKMEEKDRILQEQDQQISRLRESSSLLSQLVSEIEASFKQLPSNAHRSESTLSVRSSSNLRSIEMLKHIRLYINDSLSATVGKDKNLREVENDLAALESRIMNLDTGVTPTYTEDNIHGDTPTPTRQLSIVSQSHEGVTESCSKLLKKLDVVQIGFVQIQTQNKQMVNEINSLKKASDSLAKTKQDLEGICKVLDVSLRDVDTSNISHVVRVCKSGAESKVKEVDIKEGIIQRTRSDLDRLREDIHNLWEYVSDDNSGTPGGDKSDRTASRSSNKKQSTSVKATPSRPSTKEEMDQILRQFNKLKGENSTLYATLQEKDGTVIDAESKLKVERTHLAQQVKDRDEKLAQTLIECESLKTELNKAVSEKEKAEENAEKEKSSLHKLKDQLVELEEEFTKVKDTYEARVDDLQKKLRESAEESDKLSKENQNLLTRLSSVASAQLTDGNPSIADLSDINRPTKIAEKFSELYDNEWTEAFEALTGQYHMSEKEAVDSLLRILKDCYNFGKVAASGQLSELHKVLLMLHTSGRTRETLVLSSIKKLSKEEIKAVKDLRKTCAVHATRAVLKLFNDTPDGRTVLSDSQQLSCSSFISRAVELCWFMNVQDPPLAITWSVKPGESCDTSRYKQFTHSGQFVEFLVWPPLYLFKDGHLLSKGVVQCI